MTNQNLPDTICQVVKSGNRFNAYDTNGVKMTSDISTKTRKRAFNQDCYIGRFTTKTGRTQWRLVEKSMVDTQPTNTTSNEEISSVDVPTEHEEVLQFIHSSFDLKPKSLMM